MSVSAFCQAVREQWVFVAQLIWPESVEQRTQTVASALADELARRYRALVRRRQRIERLRARLACQERHLAEQTARVATALMTVSAYDRGLALDRIRRQVDCTRQRLARQEQVYAGKREALERRNALYREMLRGHVVAADESSGLVG